MFGLLKGRRLECRNLWDVLENADPATPWQSVLSPQQRAHAAHCDECRGKLQDLEATREILGPLQSQSDISRPWFASRVMSAIAAREAELSRALSAWTLIPKLASRVAWGAALAILMAVGLFYQKPMPPPAAGDSSPESLFDNAPSQANHDDVLISMAEKE